MNYFVNLYRAIFITIMFQNLVLITLNVTVVLHPMVKTWTTENIVHTSGDWTCYFNDVCSRSIDGLLILM